MSANFVRVARFVWAWEIWLRGDMVAGGYCRTKRDAENDARIWMEDNA